MNEAKLFKFWLDHAGTVNLEAELDRLEECIQRPYHHMTINKLTGQRDGIRAELTRRQADRQAHQQERERRAANERPDR